MFQQIFNDERGHIFVLHGRFLDRAHRRQSKPASRIFDLGPQHARRIEQRKTVGDIDPLLALGHRRLISRLRDRTTGQRIDQGGFPDVGDTDNHCHNPFSLVLLMRQHPSAERRDRANQRNVVGGDGSGFDAIFPFVPRQPLFGQLRVRQITLCQHLERRLVTPKFAQHWILAAVRNPRVENLDQHVNFRQRGLNFIAGLVHMARKPLNLHGVHQIGNRTEYHSQTGLRWRTSPLSALHFRVGSHHRLRDCLEHRPGNRVVTKNEAVISVSNRRCPADGIRHKMSPK